MNNIKSTIHLIINSLNNLIKSKTILIKTKIIYDYDKNKMNCTNEYNYFLSCLDNKTIY